MADKKDSKLAELEQKLEELTADLQRERADFANFRRRSDEDKIRAMQSASELTIKQLLPTLDNLAKVLSHLPSSVKEDAWAVGLQESVRQTEKTFEQMGVNRMAAVGEEFDPNLHEAIAHDETGGHTVLEEYQTGYTLGDKVLRHAMVKVGTQKKSKKEAK
jgi:molecular chaperone GrpE